MSTTVGIRSLVVLSLILTSSACSTVTREIEQVDKQSAQRTTEVKSALIASDEVDAAAIRVSVQADGSLLLSGFVETEAERQAAIKAARDALQGGQVVDQLELR